MTMATGIMARRWVVDFMHDGTLLTDPAALRELYRAIPPTAAIAKEIDYVHPHYRAMIEARHSW